MFSWIKEYLERRREIRDRYKADAEKLASVDPENAYYNAQRMAARYRCAGHADGFMHWSRVAAEIARIEPQAEMDFAKVQAINDREEARQRQRETRPQSR